MHRNTALGLVAAAGALGALLARRRRPEAPAAVAVEPDPRAAELRRKLARTRAEPPPSDEPPRDELDAMRRRIHAEAREAAERMRASGESPEA